MDVVDEISMVLVDADDRPFSDGEIKRVIMHED